MIDLYTLAKEQDNKQKIEMSKEKEEEKMKSTPPTYDIKKLLSDHNAKEAIEKLNEQNINSEAFWDLDDTNLKEILDIKVFGIRKNLLQAMAEIKRAHEEELAEKEKAKKVISRDARIELISC